MTVAHYEDETASECHPLDMLERCVEDNGWPFERSGRDELNLSVAGRWCDHHFCFTWREDLQSLHLSSAFDMRVERFAPHRRRRPPDVHQCEAVDRPFRSVARGRHARLPPCDDLPRCARQLRPMRSAAQSRASKRASTTTLHSSSCCGAARPRKKPSRPPCSSVPDKRKPHRQDHRPRRRGPDGDGASQGLDRAESSDPSSWSSRSLRRNCGASPNPNA